MNTRETKPDVLQDFCKELKEIANCSDRDIRKFLDFLDNTDQFISRLESSETSF